MSCVKKSHRDILVKSRHEIDGMKSIISSGFEKFKAAFSFDIALM